MSKAANPRTEKAKRLFAKGLPLAEIAKKLDVPAGTVRRWKSEGKWDIERSDTEQDANAETTNVRKQRGGQAGNKNAVGNEGGAPEGNKNSLLHGYYSKFISVEEIEMLAERGEITEEQRIKMQLDLLEIRQMRLMERGVRNAASPNELVVDRVTRSGDETSTTAISTFERMVKLETIMTAAQRTYIRGVEALRRLQNQEDKSNEVADDWIAAMSEVSQDDQEGPN